MVPVGNKQQRTSARECFKWVGKTTPPVTVSWISGLHVRSHTWISGDAGGGQPGAGDGEAGDGGGQPPDGGAPVPGGGGGGLHLEVGWFLAFPMPVSNPCSVMIGRVLSKDLSGEEGDGVSVHWYTPKRSKNLCRRSVYGRGSWSTDFVYDSNNKRVADSGIESASVACFTFPCLLASGKLPAAVWVALEENVEPPSEAEEEEEEEGGGGRRETTCKRWRRGGGGFCLVRVAIACP